MILAIVFAHVWGVIQLILLGSLARTVRVRTVLAAIAVGLYAIGPLTVLLQLGWIHLAASLLGMSVPELTRLASYSVDPFLEEALKLLPLAMLLLLIPAIRRQWLVTDCVLIAAATGSGYGLAENLYRYAGSPGAAHAIAGGWAIAVGRFTTVLVPGIANTLTSWLPPGTSFVGDTARLNSHMVWSALGGLALGLIVRYQSRAARVTAGALFLYIGLDHAVWNASLVPGSWLSVLAAPLGALAAWGGLFAIVALAVAWRLDRSTQPTDAALEPLLAAERAASPRISGTLRAAFSRLPWSVFWVGGFARARRACHAARAVEATGQDDLFASVVAQRDRIDQDLVRAESPTLLPPGLSPSALRSALRQPAVIISLILLAPSIMFLVIAGWPRTAWLQAVMIGPVVWPVVVLITIVTQARMAWRVIASARNWPRTRLLPVGDDAANVGFQLACGIGAVGLGGFTLMRVFSGVPPGASLLSSAHGADAANRVTPGSGMAVANSGDANSPPPATPELPPDALPSTPPAPKGDAAEPPPAAPPAHRPAAPPKPTPAQEAAKAEARAVKAEADALAARQRQAQANSAADAAEIAAETADPGSDPAVAAARARARQAHDASEAADRAALDGDDPWDPNAPHKAAAEKAQSDARAAEAEQHAAEYAFRQRKAADVEAAKAAARKAGEAVNAADAKAAAARENATKAAHRVADAKEARSARVARVDDP